MTTLRSTAAILAVLVAFLSLSHGFVQSPSRIVVARRNQGALLKHPRTQFPPFRQEQIHRTHSVACFGFNLPPGKKDSGLQDILVGAASIVGLIAFFASPLGGLFFAAVNSLFALAFITPLLLIFAFNVWQYFNIVEANCPSCGAPIRVLKDGSPSICFSCGSVVQSNDGTSIDFAPNVDQFEQDDSIFGSIFGGDSFMRDSSQRQPEEKKEQYRRERTVIDVDVEDVDKK